MSGKPQTKRQAALVHSGMLPRSLVSQQQNQYQQRATEDKTAKTHFFNIPPPTQLERAYYPSMDPQRVGALAPSQECEKKSGLEKHQPMSPPNGQRHQHLNPHWYGTLSAAHSAMSVCNASQLA